jgi:type IV pilus assembly protein PilM
MLASDKILALDIGASSVKVGEFAASRTHGLRLTNFNYADLGIDPEHEENRKALIVSTIRNVLREKNIHTTRAIFSVSGQSVFTRFVKLPPVEESKVAQIIQYEAQQNVPFPIDEVIWDYQLVGSSQDGELEVVLLAIKSEIIEDLNEGVESAGLRTEMVDVAPMALYNAVRYNVADAEGCTMIVDIGARTTNLLFIENNRVFSRSIPIAGNAITQSIAAEFGMPFVEAEQLKRAKGFVALGGAYEEPPDEQQARVSKIIRNVMTRLHAEVARSVNFYRSQQGGGAPTRLYLSGGTSIIPYTNRFFEEKVQIPIEYFNPFRNVEIDSHVPREELARCAHFFGEVVGLGLRRVTECPLEVNLLPHSIRGRKQMQDKRPFLAGAAAALVLIPLCWLAYTKRTASLNQMQLDQVKTQVESLQVLDRTVREEKAKLDEVKAKADQIAGLVKQRSLWPEFLQDINERLVPNIWIVSLVPQSSTPTVGGGAAPSRPRGRIRERNPDEEGGGEEAPAPQQPSGPVALSEVRIDGAGVNSQDAFTVLREFAQRLRASPFANSAAGEKSVDIVTTSAGMGRESVFTFTMVMKLAKPITL